MPRSESRVGTEHTDLSDKAIMNESLTHRALIC